jgi:hypothetical protein
MRGLTRPSETEESKVSDDSNTIAVCEGDEIVIRMPVERLIRILEHAVQHGKHDRNIEVLDRDQLIEDVLGQINTGTGNEPTWAEDFFVHSALFALEDGSTAMRENGAYVKAS